MTCRCFLQPLLSAAIVTAVVVLPCVSISPVVHAQLDDQPPVADFPGLDIQAVVGWDGHVDQSAPTPFSFLLSNFSQDTIEGDLTLTNPESNQTLRLGRLFIGPGGARRFSAIHAVPDWIQCIAKFSNNGRVLWQRELALATGRDFSEDLNYVLFVDEEGRLLPLPRSENGGSGLRQYVPQTGRGRTVQPVSVRPWQVAQHPGPLTVAQGMVFAESMKAESLNDAQWDAVGKWICMGGTVFVFEKSTELIERIRAATPLIEQPPILADNLTTYRCGQGSIREYAGSLFSASESQPSVIIAIAASQLSRHSTTAILESMQFQREESPNAEITRIWVVTLFIIYTLLSGSALFLMRLSRRGMLTFTGSVVATACIAASVLGGMLRNSSGDLQWISITRGGSGGMTQMGKINVQSAGGRNTRAAVSGTHVDLQLTESAEVQQPYYYYNYYEPEVKKPAFPCFTWQPNQQKDRNDAYQVGVPITPWGFRQLYATAFQPDQSRIDLKMEFAVDGISGGQYQPKPLEDEGWRGKLRITATSRLPFELTDCHVVIAMTQMDPNDERNQQATYGMYDSPPANQTAGIPGLTQFQAMIDLGSLSPNVANFAESPRPSEFLSMSDLHRLHRRSMRWMTHRVAYSGATGVWIVGRIANSPLLRIDEKNCDFELLNEEHWFVQEVLPEELPAEWRGFCSAILTKQLTEFKARQPEKVNKSQ